MDINNILKNNNLIFIYGNVYSGKYNKLYKELANKYSIYEYNYLDFYYNNDWNKKLEYILNNTSNFVFENKKKLLIIREVEIIFKK